jgi:hypothetical protein
VFGWKATDKASLSTALGSAEDGDVIVVSAGDTPIELTEPLPAITASVTIEGNGVTLRRNSEWTGSNSTSQLLRITNPDAEVTIRGVRFKDGESGYQGRAVYNAGRLTLESCIFDTNTPSTNDAGGAVYSSGDLIIRGCTFYKNKANDGGGAVYFDATEKTLTLTGNLFFNNSSPVVKSNVTVVSSYNVVDVSYAAGEETAGFGPGEGDITISSAPFETESTITFVPTISELNIVMTLDFMATDFYGDTRTTFTAV